MPRWLRWVFLAALAGWVAFQSSHLTVVAGGADSSGYLNSARLLADGRMTMPQRLPPELHGDISPYHFMPLGFWMAPEAGHIAPTYPPGLPLHFAAGGRLLGWEHGPRIVMLLGTVACFLLLHAIGRELGLSPWLAAAGPGMLAFCPVLVFSALQPLSDLLATTWCCAAVYTALRARRGGNLWAAGAGTCVALAVLVRPSNVLLLPALVILLGDWRRLIAAGAAGLPWAVGLGYVNHTLYGSAFQSGYGDISTAFGTRWILPSLGLYARWLPVLIPAVVLVLPVAAFLGWRQRKAVLLALAAWLLAFLAFYACYAVTHEVWWCLRFVLPAIPALLLLALLGLEAVLVRAAARARWWQPGLAVGLVAWAAMLFAYWNPRFALLQLGRYENAYREAAHWAQTRLPANAIVATLPASGSLYHYTDFPVLRWDTMPAEVYQGYASRLRQGGRPIYAMLFPGEEQPALHDHMPGRWEKIGEVSGITFWQDAASPP